MTEKAKEREDKAQNLEKKKEEKRMRGQMEGTSRDSPPIKSVGGQFVGIGKKDKPTVKIDKKLTLKKEIEVFKEEDYEESEAESNNKRKK